LRYNRVRIHASSLNYHDYGVVRSHAPAFSRRITLSDEAGEVELSAKVCGFAVGDAVVSTFFPFWSDGGPRVGDFATVPAMA
jgi:NADPH:quinone reductase-like Zn-dependent oxidoreductase